MGTSIAKSIGYFDTFIFALAISTTVAFQIISNFANDYGDGVKGTDNDERIGPKRAYQSGLLSRKELEFGILTTIIIALALVSALLYISFGSGNMIYILSFGFLGIISIWAAVKYTMGNSAYGYKGFGDLFVFLFFGLLAVLGSMFLFTKFLTWHALLPAATIGLLCTGVLNLNNLRDFDSDKKANKKTMIVQMGYNKGIQYHTFLLATAFACLLLYTIITYQSFFNFIPLFAFIPIFTHWKRVKNSKDQYTLDPELKKLALSTFLLSLLFFFGFNFFL